MSSSGDIVVHVVSFVIELILATASASLLLNRRNCIFTDAANQGTGSRSQSLVSSGSEVNTRLITKMSFVRHLNTPRAIFVQVFSDERCWFCFWCAAVFLQFMFFNIWAALDGKFFQQTLLDSTVWQQYLTVPVATMEYCAIVSLIAIRESGSVTRIVTARLNGSFIALWLGSVIVYVLASSSSAWLRSLFTLVTAPILSGACAWKAFHLPSGMITLKLRFVLSLEAISLAARVIVIVLGNSEASEWHWSGTWAIIELATTLPLALALILLHF